MPASSHTIPKSMAHTRSWTSRSQATSGLPSSTGKHEARLHEPSSMDGLLSERVGPLRSRRSWQGGVGAAGLPGTGHTLRHGSDARSVSGKQKIAEPADSPTIRREPRYATSEAYAVDAAVVAGQTGWISPSDKQMPQNQDDGNFLFSGIVPSSSGGGGSGGIDGNDSNNLESASGTEKGGAGSSLRSGGRGNFFFGADYAGKKKRVVHPLAEKTYVAEARLPVDAKPATPLGFEGSSEEVSAEEHELFGNVRGEGNGSDAGCKILALRDIEKPSVGSGSASIVGKTEAPPGLAPLGEDEQSKALRLINAGGSRGSTGRVDFPPGFDAAREGSNFDDSANGKTRGDGSLGTKSGSTSLLSMLSASPRSLSTAQDSAAGSPSPRTPLSDDSLETRREVSGGLVAGDTARRHRSAPIARSGSNDIASASAFEPWTSGSGPIATQGSEKLSRSSSTHLTDRSSAVSPSVAPPRVISRFNVPIVIMTIDDDDVPSAHPTPLYALNERDDDVPSAHPTPLSTAGRSRPGKSDGGEGERCFDKNTAKKPTDARVNRHVGRVSGSGTASSESLNPSASSFMDRLKYFGGGSGVSTSNRGNVKSRAAAATWQGRGAWSPSTSEQQEISPAERRGMPVAPIADSLEEPSPAPYTKSVAVEVPSRQFVSNTTSISEEIPSTPRVVMAGAVAAFTRECGRNATSIAVGDSEVRRIPSPSPGRYRDRQHRMGGLVNEPLPAFVSHGPSMAVSADSDVGSVFNNQKDPNPVSVGSRLAGVAEIPPVASGTPGFVVAPSTTGRRSPFVETVGHEDELIDRVFQDTQEGFHVGDDESEESDMDWEAGSDDEEKVEEPQCQPESRNVQSSTPSETTARPLARGLGSGPHPVRSPVAPPAPRYMAIVDAASASSALNSSTSEHDTSLSEDDGGMMAEILTDRLMEVAHKMEAAAPPPADELSDGEGGLGVGGEGGRIAVAGGRRRAASRTFSKDLTGASSRRHVYQSSALPSGSRGGLELEEKGADSDEESVVAGSAAARKLRRERVRKRSRSNARRNLSAVLNVPVDSSGAPINVHTAAYNGHQELLEAYITQGGDIEARDQFQATALMLCAERGHVEMVDVLLAAGADTFCVDENGNSALHLACFYGNREVVRLLLTVDCDVTMTDAEGRTPLQLATDPVIRRLIQQEEVVRISGDKFDLLEAVEVNDTSALLSFIQLGQEACGYPGNMNAVAVACKRLRLNRQGRGGMTAVHLAAFHGYADSLRILLEAGADPNAVCDDGETPLHTACTGGSTACATLLLDHGGNPLATDAKGLVPCEKHIAAGRQEMKRLLEAKAFQATPANLMALRNDLAEVALQIDAEEDLFVRKGVAIKYLRKALKKKEQDTARLRAVVDARDNDIRNLRDRMDSVYILISGISSLS